VSWPIPIVTLVFFPILSATHVAFRHARPGRPEPDAARVAASRAHPETRPLAAHTRSHSRTIKTFSVSLPYYFSLILLRFFAISESISAQIRLLTSYCSDSLRVTFAFEF
jgi:hypothetical protein